MKTGTIILIGTGFGILVAASLGGRYVYGKIQLAKIEGDAADKHGFPRWWFVALGLQETGLSATSVNMTGTDKARGGSWGLNQISVLTARKHGFDGEPKELLDPIVNADWTGRILSAPLDRWDRLREPPRTFSQAASMWNGGFYPGDVPPTGHKDLSRWPAITAQVDKYVASALNHSVVAETMA